MLILGSTAITSVIVFGLHGPKNLLALALSRLALRVGAAHLHVARACQPDRTGRSVRPARRLSTGVVVAASVGVTLVAAAVTWWRVVATEVTR